MSRALVLGLVLAIDLRGYGRSHGGATPEGEHAMAEILRFLSAP